MPNPEIASTENPRPSLAAVPAYGGGGNWNQPPIASTGGGGGGDMEKRVTKLETKVEGIESTISEIKEDIREVRNIGLALILFAYAGVGGLYLFIDHEGDTLTKSISDLQISVTEKHSELDKNYQELLRKDEDVLKKLNGIESSLNKLVGINDIIIKQ